LSGLCNDESIEYIIHIIDEFNQTIVETQQYHSTSLVINHLKSFKQYSFLVYAKNELGLSPKSNLLTIQTLQYG